MVLLAPRSRCAAGKIYLEFSGGPAIGVKHEFTITNNRTLTGRRGRDHYEFATLLGETNAASGGFVPRQNSERVSAGGRVEIIILSSGVDPDDIRAELRCVLSFRHKKIETARGEQNFGGRKSGGSR